MNNKLIRLDEATQLQVFSRDLREYVVPVRELNRLHTVDDAEQTEALLGGATCVFCGMQDACGKYRSVMKGGDRA